MELSHSGSSVLGLWVAPAAIAASLALARGWPFSGLGLILAARRVELPRLLGPRIVSWFRRTTVASRILALFVAFLIPALLLYPALDFFAGRATRRLITEQYAVQAQTHPQTLQALMAQAQKEIDALTGSARPGVRQSRPAADDRQRLSRVASDGARARAADLRRRALQPGRAPRQPIRAEHPGIHRRGANGTDGQQLRLGSVRRGGAYRFGRTPHAARRAADLRALRRRRRAQRRRHHRAARGLRLPNAALHLLAESVFRVVPRERPAALPPRRARAGEVEIAIYGWGLPAALHLDSVAVADRRCAVCALVRLTRALLDDIQAGGTRHRVYFSNDRAWHLRDRLSRPVVIRSSRSSGGAHDARRRRFPHRPARNGSVHQAEPPAAESRAARCCARYEPASTASSFSRSCWRRSFRS